MPATPTPLFIALLGATIVAGCSPDAGDRSAPAPEAEAGQRVVHDVQWSEQRIAGGTEGDTLVGQVGPMKADGAGVIVSDVYRGTVTRFAREGAIEWVSGRGGGGPGEFGRVVDLAQVGGSTWVLDSGNMRVTVLSEAGALLAERSLSALRALPTGVLPDATGTTAWYLTSAQDQPLVRLGGRGEVLGTAPLPWDSAALLPSLATQATAAADVQSGVLYLGFQLADGLLRFDGDPAGGSYRGFIEPIPLPTVEVESSGGRTVSGFAGTPTFGARALSVGDGVVYIHFGGDSDDRLAVIDVHDAETLRYLRSYRLPRRVSTAVVAWPDVYATFSDPYPTIVRYTAVGDSGPE